MNKYSAIIDRKTIYVVLLCIVLTHLCFRFKFSFDLNVTLFSIAIIFPLVFTIREAFKARDSILELLSVFKSSLNAVYYCFANSKKLSDEKKDFIAASLNEISLLFFNALKTDEYHPEEVRAKLDEVYEFLEKNREGVSTGAAFKIIRFLKDVHESVENTIGLKMHGTPISLRAYCLVFIYMFPFIFVPTLIYDLRASEAWVVYSLASVHGFILISLYNVQDAMEDPFDQIGLDDIRLEEFHFRKSTMLTTNASSSETVSLE